MIGPVLRRLTGLLRPQRRLMVVSILCRVANQGLGVLIPPVAVAYVFSVVEGSAPGTGTIAAVLITLALVKGVFRYLEQYTGHAVAFRLLADLRNEVFRWLERLEPSRLADERSGDLVARVSGDLARVEPFYAHTIAPVLASVLVPLITLAGLATVVDPRPAVALAIVVVVYLAEVPWLASRRVALLGAEARRMSGETAAVVADVVQGSHEIAVLGAGKSVLDSIERSDAGVAQVQRRLAAVAGWRTLLGGVFSCAAVVAVGLVGITSGLGVADVAVSIVVAWTIMTPLRALEEIVPDSEQALASAARLFELAEVEPQTSGDAEMAAAGIRLNAVTVVAGSETIVEAVDLSVPEGSFLGVVGPSGSGKTTLVSTLLRHRDPESGEVLIGGRRVSDWEPTALRRAVALVPQRPDVFHGTVLSNLLIAKPDADEAEVRIALARVGLLDWVQTLDYGLETSLGEGGVGMSGGQIQRLALARALLRDPRILILDEATSELDTVAERTVLDEVYSERGARTLIVVAHRMETVVSADAIAVMDRGLLVDVGTHETLRAADGVYAALWRRHEDLLPADR